MPACRRRYLQKSIIKRMIFLHATFVESRFQIWGETEVDPVAAKNDLDWPFALKQNHLSSLLARIGYHAADVHAPAFLFPVCNGVAIPSSTLFGDSPASCSNAKLCRFQV